MIYSHTHCDSRQPELCRAAAIAVATRRCYYCNAEPGEQCKQPPNAGPALTGCGTLRVHAHRFDASDYDRARKELATA